jgi:uncharacterized small protein (DUF1192 family)
MSAEDHPLGRLTSVTFEHDGFPCDLGTEQELREGVSRRRLRPETLVTVTRTSGRPQLRRADEVPELADLFDEAAMTSPANTLVVLRRLVAERVQAEIANASAGAAALSATAAEDWEKRIAVLENEVSTLRAELTALRSPDEGTSAQAAPAPAQPASAAKPGLSARSREELFTDYRRLLREPSPKPRQFREFFGRFAEARGLHSEGDQLLLGLAQSPDALVIAIEQEGHYEAVPGFAYASIFGRVYTDRRQNPPLISLLFELTPGTSGLDLLRPAQLKLISGTRLRLIAQGALSGFTG